MTYALVRVAQSAEAQKRRCTKILVVDENPDPQHTLFCREISFVAVSYTHLTLPTTPYV